MKSLKEIIKLQDQCEKLEKEYKESCSEDGIGIRDANASKVFILLESFKRLIRALCESWGEANENR